MAGTPCGELLERLGVHLLPQFLDLIRGEQLESLLDVFLLELQHLLLEFLLELLQLFVLFMGDSQLFSRMQIVDRHTGPHKEIDFPKLLDLLRTQFFFDFGSRMVPHFGHAPLQLLEAFGLLFAGQIADLRQVSLETVVVLLRNALKLQPLRRRESQCPLDTLLVQNPVSGHDRRARDSPTGCRRSATVWRGWLTVQKWGEKEGRHTQ